MTTPLNPHSTETTRPRRRRKALLFGIAGLVAAGVAAGGALTSLNTVLGDNHFKAAVPTDAAGVHGSLLEVTGAPFDKEFDTTTYNDLVQGTWNVVNHGDADTVFDGTLAPNSTVDDSLAKNLKVYYGDEGTADTNTQWHAAGTLANPVSYDAALGLGPEHKIGGNKTISIPVRVLLQDPTKLDGDPETTLHVDADFTVSYLLPESAK
ncbi:hypothetical protein ACFOYW_18510 [Gryllotalpicola reticulitermitis]|uniref:Alternate signal-mediated exported protein, RER_14450 family n=1 Tax=Gryllotalpicola reticulitermitis TaxID=1184153 RepID=A0ABV8QAT5_9MICO